MEHHDLNWDKSGIRFAFLGRAQMNSISISAIPRAATLGLKANTTLESVRHTTDFASTIEQIQKQGNVTPAPAPTTKQPLPTAERSSPAGVHRRTLKSDRDQA